MVICALVLMAVSSLFILVPAYLLQPFINEGMKTGSSPVTWKIPWKLLEMDPDVNAIVSSGYFDDPVMSHFKNHGFRCALPKPYSKKDLESALKLAME